VEAKLAREAEIAYASLAAVTDYDCWHADHDEVSVDMIIQNLLQNVDKSKAILKLAIPRVGKIKRFGVQDALKNAIITRHDMIPEQKKKELAILIGKYVK
jgi:5'-methylthioadenosine phosphorylase